MKPSDSHIQQALALFELKGPATYLRKVENWIYTVDDGSLFLRITEAKHRSLSQLESELHWIGWLVKRGAHAVVPRLSSNGRRVETLENAFYLSVFEKAPGVELGHQNLTPKAFETWGKALGHFHRLTKEYEPPSKITPRAQWEDAHPTQVFLKAAQKESSEIKAIADRNIAFLESLSKTKENFGLIHADLHQGNFLYEEKSQRLTAFDFDDSLYHWFIYDIAVVIFHLTNHHERHNQPFQWSTVAPDFWKGYDSENALPESEKAKLSEFVLHRTLLIYFWVQSEFRDVDECVQRWADKTLASCRKTILGERDLLA